MDSYYFYRKKYGLTPDWLHYKLNDTDGMKRWCYVPSIYTTLETVVLTFSKQMIIKSEKVKGQGITNKSVYKSDMSDGFMSNLDTCANCHHGILHHYFPINEDDRRHDNRHYCKLCECQEFKETYTEGISYQQVVK